jgi:hypothetical protein
LLEDLLTSKETEAKKKNKGTKKQRCPHSSSSSSFSSSSDPRWNRARREWYVPAGVELGGFAAGWLIVLLFQRGR